MPVYFGCCNPSEDLVEIFRIIEIYHLSWLLSGVNQHSIIYILTADFDQDLQKKTCKFGGKILHNLTVLKRMPGNLITPILKISDK